MFVVAPLGGYLADRLNKKVILITTQTIFALCALTLSIAVWTNHVTYEMILGVALIVGCAASVDMPTRQSMIAQVVSQEEIPQAIPLNAGTFNTARMVGPALGGWVLERYGPGTCYFVNALSFLAIIVAVALIRSDLRSNSVRTASLRETLLEGIRYVFQHPAFRWCVVMVMTTSVFGFFYLALLPALAASSLGVGKQGLGLLMTATGVGALLGILTLAVFITRLKRGWMISLAMLGFGIALLSLSFVKSFGLAFLCLLVMGMCGIIQMAGTNATLQYSSPPDLRGRVVAVHVWALQGLNPFGALFFGWFSERFGIPVAFAFGGAVVLLMAMLVVFFSKAVRSL
jgi:predicted MFS family arabinose efflux permease